MSHTKSSYKAPRFIDSRAKSGKTRRNPSKYYPGAVFVQEGKPENTFVIEHARADSNDVQIFGKRHVSSKQIIGSICRHIRTEDELYELRQQLHDLNIIIPGMDKAKIK